MARPSPCLATCLLVFPPIPILRRIQPRRFPLSILLCRSILSLAGVIIFRFSTTTPFLAGGSILRMAPMTSMVPKLATMSLLATRPILPCWIPRSPFRGTPALQPSTTAPSCSDRPCLTIPLSEAVSAPASFTTCSRLNQIPTLRTNSAPISMLRAHTPGRLAMTGTAPLDPDDDEGQHFGLARIRHRFGISSSLCWYWTRIGSRYPSWVVRRYARRVFGPFQERLLPVHRATLTWIANCGRAPASASRRCSVNAVQRWSSYPGSRHSGSRCRFASTSAKTLA